MYYFSHGIRTHLAWKCTITFIHTLHAKQYIFYTLNRVYEVCTMFGTPKRNSQITYKVYTSIYICLSVRPSIRVSLCKLVRQFLRHRSENFHNSFFPKKLFICRNRRYQTSMANSCPRNKTMGIKCLYGDLFCFTRYLQKIWHDRF